MKEPPEADREPVASSTRDALLGAGIRLFGRQGFDGTSTRSIAALARTNVASIAYHFGGKAELRLACARSIADRMVAVFDGQERSIPAAPAMAEESLVNLAAAFLEFLFFQPDAQDTVAFILRELAEDGPAVELLYEAVMEPRHSYLCQVWEAATGEPAESEPARLAIFTLIGQVVYFRIGYPLVCRRMDWQAIGSDEMAALKARVSATVRVLAAAAREERR